MKLLEALPLGSAEARNRVVFGPHATNLCRGRSMSERHVDYYQRRARGGAGLIVTETASVHELDWPHERAPLASECSRGWRDIADACHTHGSLVVASLGHAGMQGTSAYSQREVMAPSRVPDAVTRELPKEMEPADIADVLDGFAAATRAAMDAGLDGVEINAGQYSLVRQFLSGLTNLRSDEWGPGDDGAGRIRFAIEAIARARTAVGGGIVGLRLSCNELAPWAGITPEAAAELAAEFAPLVDYLVVVQGSIYSADATRPDSHIEPGFNLDLVEEISAAVDGDCVVVAQGSIVDPFQAEWEISERGCDAVEMTRAQIADPDLVARTAAGQPPRPCVLCNQKCRVNDGRNPIVSCTVNPSAGFEGTEPEVPAPADHSRAIAIVGAGPAGLEAAHLLAKAGHRVTVHDQAHETGTVVRDWAATVGREPFAAIIDWLETECRSSGVTLDLGHRVTPSHVAALEDAGTDVVICTGSITGHRSYDIAVGAPLVDAADLLADRRAGHVDAPTGNVAIIDPIGGPIGISIAETLANTADVTLITNDVIAGTMLAITGDLASAGTRLLQAGVTIEKRQVPRSVTATGVEVEDRFTGERRFIAADLVIDAGHRLPSEELTETDAGRLRPMAGDVVAPRSVHEAVLEGRRLAFELCDRAPLAASR